MIFICHSERSEGSLDSSVAIPSLCSGLRLIPQNDNERRAQNDKRNR